MTKASTEKKRTYVLQAGNHFEYDEKTGKHVERKAGDFVQLSDSQAIAFADKVKSKAEHEAEIGKSKKIAAALAAIEADDAAADAKRQEELEAGESEENEEEEEEEEPTEE